MTPITIQQTAEQARLAFEFHTHAEIQSIRLRKARLLSDTPIEADIGPIALTLHQKARHVPGADGLFRLDIDFRLEGRREAGDPNNESHKIGQPFVLVECTWEVDYRLAEGYQPTPRTVRAFKDGNAIFNCWPYFREFVQNAVTRMNLPPLTLPLLRLLPKPPAERPGGPRGRSREKKADSRTRANGGTALG
jgi:hypothetical protein